MKIGILLKEEQGLSLIEVIAAVLLLTIILTSFMQVFLMGVKTKVASEENVTGVYTVQNEIEDLIAASEATSTEQEFLLYLTGTQKYIKKSESPLKFVRSIDNSQDEFRLEIKDIPSNQQWGGTVRLAILTQNKTGDNTIQQKFQAVLIW